MKILGHVSVGLDFFFLTKNHYKGFSLDFVLSNTPLCQNDHSVCIEFTEMQGVGWAAA